MKKLLLFIPIILCSFILEAETNGEITADTNNIIVVKVWGTHAERGFAYGSLLGSNISSVFTYYLKPQFGTYYSLARDIVTADQDLKFDSLFIVEAKSIIEGMNDTGTNTADMDYIDMLVCNSFLDIAKLMSKSMNMGCSSLISWGDATTGTDLDGKSVISRHLDWTPNIHLVSNQIMLVCLPSEIDEQPWCGIGFAGMFSVLSGFNENIGVFQHMMNDYSGGTQHGKGYKPVWCTLRNAIEKLDYNQDGANNTEDVRAAISDNPFGFADGFIISAMARSTETDDSLIAMIAEIAPSEPYLVFRSNAYPDSIPSDNIYTANYQIARNNDMHFCSRYNSVKNAINNGTDISIDVNWEIMRDYSHLSGNIQFMQYAPEIDLFKISSYYNSMPAYQIDPISFSIQELFDDNVGVNEITNSEITFYPNPVDNILTIKSTFSDKKITDITIRNIYGRNINFECIKISEDTYQIHTEDFTYGVYIVSIQAKNYSTSFKILK